MSRTGSHSYRVVREENSTAVGEVYEATHPDQPGRFLVELLNGVPVDDAAQAAFEHDLKAVAELDHPLVLEFHELGAQPDGTPVLIHVLPEGMSLSRWLEEGRAARPEEAGAFIAGLADALTTAHEHGIAHGTLRAEYVYLVRSSDGELGSPRLRGFGQRWLEPGSSPEHSRQGVSPGEIADDVRELASLAEVILTPPDRRGLGIANEDASSALIRAVLDGEERPETAREFAAALVRTLAAHGTQVRAPTRFLTTRLRVSAQQGSRLAVGLAWGVGLALVVVVVSQVPVALERRKAERAASPMVEIEKAPATADVRDEAAPLPIVRPAPRASERLTRLARPAPAAESSSTSGNTVRPEARAVAMTGKPMSKPAVAAPDAATVAEVRRPAPPPPRRGVVVWSDSQQKLITVDDHGDPLDPPPATTPHPEASPKPAPVITARPAAEAPARPAAAPSPEPAPAPAPAEPAPPATSSPVVPPPLTVTPPPLTR
jgi:hypothetical protein